MPVKSKRQWAFMQTAAHSKSFADKHGIKQEDARKFIAETPKETYAKLPTRVKSPK